MPVSNLLATLIDRLLDLTNEGRIDWQETASENDFLAGVSQYVVTIGLDAGEDSWGNSTPRYWIRVADQSGKLIETASDADFAGFPNESLKLLYDGARRKALNVDKALSELISSLDSIGRAK